MNQEMLSIAKEVNAEIRSACDTFRLILRGCEKAVRKEISRLQHLTEEEFTKLCYRWILYYIN